MTPKRTSSSSYALRASWRTAPRPLSITEVLNKVPPFQLGDQVVAEAQRLAGVTAAAIYLCDLDGTTLQRMAGGGGFPDQIAVPLAVGPEIPREGVEPLRARIDETLPGVLVAPMFLRGRALGVLVAIGATDDALRDLASEAAAAIALADEYTDAISAVRRVRPTSPAAEIQQNLLPPRILRIAGAMVAGNVLPGYDIGGDWFDYAENRECAWIGIADPEGEGAAAASLSRNKATAHVTISCWNGATSAIRWVTCGDHAPILITADGELEVLEGVLPLFGKRNLPLEPGVHERRLSTANASSSSLTPSSTGPRSTARRWDWRACAKLR